MALYAFDGTWNREYDGDTELARNTNVKRFFDLYEGTRNVYVAGVGTRLGFVGRIAGGLFGAGGFSRLKGMYKSLCANYSAGHTKINIVGFSRGAALALDFANLVAKRGVPGADGAIIKPTIQFMALFDVVGSFGLPVNLGFLKFQEWDLGHNLALPKDITVEHCYHALALDERRQTFMVTRVAGAHEVWFAGVHADIGGGNGNTGLNDVSLRWMAFKAQEAGLPGFTTERILAATQFCNPDAPPSPPQKYDVIHNNWRPVRAGDLLHPSVRRPRPDGNDPAVAVAYEVAHETAIVPV